MVQNLHNMLHPQSALQTLPGFPELKGIQKKEKMHFVRGVSPESFSWEVVLIGPLKEMQDLEK